MFPERIICLSGESADICARLGAADRLVAVSAFAPRELRAGRRVVGGFSTAHLAEIRDLAPDLVIAFSDVQADIAAALVREHCTVLVTNQRTLAQIADAIRLIGGAVGCAAQGEALAGDFTQSVAALRDDGVPRPRVYFEEWDDPLVSGIGWVSESIAIAGGTDVFACGDVAPASRDRQLDPAAILRADPQIIFASWCGKTVDTTKISGRDGWQNVSAVRDGFVIEVDSDLILQPGPAILAGIANMKRTIAEWRKRAGLPPKD